MAALQGIRVRITRTTRADVREPGKETPMNRTVAEGDVLTLSNDVAEQLMQTGCAVKVPASTPAAAPKPAAPAKGKPKPPATVAGKPSASRPW